MSESMIHGGMAAKPSGTAAQWRHSGGTVAARNGRLAAQWRHNLAARRHSVAATVPLAARRHSLAARRHGGTAAQPGGTAAQLGGTAARRHGGTVAAQWRHNLAARRHNWRHVCHWRHELAARRHGGTAAQWRQSQPCDSGVLRHSAIPSVLSRAPAVRHRGDFSCSNRGKPFEQGKSG
eukprot:gene13255-biopygen9964